MKIFILLFLTLPMKVFANCPYTIEVSGQSYCVEIQWLNGDIKKQGVFQESSESSPQLVLKGTVPQKWIYSKALFHIWEKNDPAQQPQQIEDFKVYPYMTMISGHHHSTSHQFYWNEVEQAYELKAMALKWMEGCWSLHWTLNAVTEGTNSQLLMNVLDFKNISQSDKEMFQNYCEVLSPQQF